MTTNAAVTTRRTELAAFLRSRRERVRPSDVGLPPGSRRRTTGLRREEVAQLAGVGVTWYTWLEQGRPIHASVQVLDAVARTLLLDPIERTHLFRLAEVPDAGASHGCSDCSLPETVQQVLDAMKPLPACVIGEMFDLRAWNGAYAALFPRLTNAPAEDRNTLLACLTSPSCCSAMADRSTQVTVLVGQLRAAYGKHLGDPVWTHFIRRMEAESEEFTRAWAAHDVAVPTSHLKPFRHPHFGQILLMSTSFAVQAVAGARMNVYTPVDDAARRALEGLAAGEGADARFPCWPTHTAA